MLSERSAVTTEMPIELPMFRSRLNRPAASVRSIGSRVEKVIVLSGTKMKPKPRPWMTPLVMIACWSVSRLKPTIW